VACEVMAPSLIHSSVLFWAGVLRADFIAARNRCAAPAKKNIFSRPTAATRRLARFCERARFSNANFATECSKTSPETRACEILNRAKMSIALPRFRDRKVLGSGSLPPPKPR
jgi:hypothetical protein